MKKVNRHPMNETVYLSEPARSTKFNLANLKWVLESFSQWLSIIQVKTLWERLLSLFIYVAAIFLFAAPWEWNGKISIMLPIKKVKTNILAVECKISRWSHLQEKLDDIVYSCDTVFCEILHVDSFLQVFPELQ